MKTKFKSTIRAVYQSFGGIICAGAVMLFTSSAPAQNLFVTDFLNGGIYQFTPDRSLSIFACGLVEPNGLAFDSAGNLFVADWVSGNIYEFTPDGTQSTRPPG